jgi:hypothetical protein
MLAYYDEAALKSKNDEEAICTSKEVGLYLGAG